MGFYSSYIFPRAMEATMKKEPFTTFRKSLLADVGGQVLEVGFGTGLNIPHYLPDQVQKIMTVDPNPGMSKRARERVEKSPIAVEHHMIGGEKLPMAENTFDAAVSTWTLCSIPNIDQALQEIRRVLKPSGKFYFIEHGLCDEPKLAKWQHRLTPIQKIFGDGCHLNRDMKTLIENQGFELLEINQFYAEKVPKIGAYMYQGIARIR